MRFVPSVADWNGDGWPDLIVGSNRVFLVMNSGKRNGPRFLPIKLVNQPGPPTAGGGVLEQIPGSTEWRLVESKQNPGLYLPYDLVAKAVDWNGDGDLDIMANASYGYLCWYERSFLHHGYAPAAMLSLNAR
jgi:hypothetical protein